MNQDGVDIRSLIFDEPSYAKWLDRFCIILIFGSLAVLLMIWKGSTTNQYFGPVKNPGEKLIIPGQGKIDAKGPNVHQNLPSSPNGNKLYVIES